MRKKYQMVLGMKEHPETGELLYPGDVFEVEEELIMRTPRHGGWLQPNRDNLEGLAPGEFDFVLVCAREVPDDRPEDRVMRDEPSKIIGVNISERDFAAGEEVRGAREAATHTAADAPKPGQIGTPAGPANVRRRG